MSAEQTQLLHRYLELLLTANQKMNLTRIVQIDAAHLLHVADALTLLPFLPPSNFRLADVGSGGGVPGIILAIARPYASVTLIESTRKKAEFLKATAAELKLTNVTVAAVRAEDAGLGPMRETFDVAVARAVATLPWLAEWLLPLVKPKGIMLAMKGAKFAEELPTALRPIRMLGGGEAEILPANLPGQEEHRIIRIGKIGRTDFRLPRSATTAGNKPLGQ